MGRRTYYFWLLKVMLTLSLIPLAFFSTYPRPYILSATIDYKSYCWVNWFKAWFFGSWLRSWSFRFFCVTYLLLAYSIRALWAPTSEALQISPDIHPLNQHHLLCQPPWPTYLSLEYGDDTSQEGASKGRFKFPLIKTSGTYLNTTSSLLGDEQTTKHGGGGKYYAN
jgi:hypothetical protein